MSKVKHKDSAIVECPFFKAQDSATIYCEGIVDGSTIHIAFATSTLKKDFRAKHCYTCYGKCPIYKINDSKYDEFGYK